MVRYYLDGCISHACTQKLTTFTTTTTTTIATAMVGVTGGCGFGGGSGGGDDHNNDNNIILWVYWNNLWASFVCVLLFKLSWSDGVDKQSVDFRVKFYWEYLKSIVFYDTNPPTRYLFSAFLFSYPYIPLSWLLEGDSKMYAILDFSPILSLLLRISRHL